MSAIIPVKASDRRAAPRVAYTFDGYTAGHSGSRPVRIGDLSVTGCFVESIEPAATGENLTIRITIPDWGTLELSAEIMYSSPPIGFGVRFVDVPPASALILQATVETLSQRQA
jgi:hypothetical protein